MEKKDLLLEIEKIIESEKYDIDELLQTVPEYLLDDLKDVFKSNLKEKNTKESLSK